jgi:hypothetical protein
VGGPDEREADGWEGTWADARRRSFTRALALTPEQRLRWLEEAIAFAHRAGALPRRRDAVFDTDHPRR